MQSLALVLVVYHPVDFRQEQSAKAMAIHRSMASLTSELSSVIVEIARDPLAVTYRAGDRLTENVFERVVDDFAVFATARLMPAGHHGQSCQTGNCDVPLVTLGPERAVGMLILR